MAEYISLTNFLKLKCENITIENINQVSDYLMEIDTEVPDNSNIDDIKFLLAGSIIEAIEDGINDDSDLSDQENEKIRSKEADICTSIMNNYHGKFKNYIFD